MARCKICETDIIENKENCGVCNYPLLGSGQEKASFVAKQVMQKSDVEVSIKRLKNSRTLLFSIAAFLIIAPVLLSGFSFPLVVWINIGMGLIFFGFGLLTFKKPKLALGIPLGLISTYYLILLFTDPMLLWSGVLWKIGIVVGLGYGYFSVRKADEILKENKYLAWVLGYNKIQNK